MVQSIMIHQLFSITTRAILMVYKKLEIYLESLIAFLVKWSIANQVNTLPNVKSRCLNCSRIGPKFPCKEENFSRKCQDCCKIFNNFDCFSHHLTSGFCNNSKQCEKCGEIWRVGINIQNGRKGHVCNEKYCGRCGDFHDPKRGCYIKPLKAKQINPYRIVAFDLETMQHKISNPAKRQRIHEANFIAAKIVCPKCISTGEWKKSLKNNSCQVCGPHRTITFSQQPYSDTVTDEQIITQNPLEEFAQWILYGLPNRYDTV
uniref:Uncharacterized protein n=1 Tax=Meloidogyne hapla TaxID=6305 RepID=A0A1I8BHR8_MELHA